MFNGFLKVMQKNYGNINRRIARAIINTEEKWPKSDSNNFFQSMFIQVAFFFNFCLPRRFWGALKSKQNRILDHLKVSYRKSNRIILFFFFFCLFIFFFFVCSKRDGKESLGTKFVNQAGQVQYVYSYIFNFPLHQQYFNSRGRPFHKVVTLK